MFAYSRGTVALSYDCLIWYLLYHYRVTHWDVNNEDLHGAFFKTKTGDTKIIDQMFYQVQTHDNNVLLFLNDYSIVSAGSSTHVSYKVIYFILSYINFYIPDKVNKQKEHRVYFGS